MKRHAAITQISRQHVGWKARLLLVEIDRDEVETKRGTIFERKQDIEERVAVLTARQAHHDAVARFDHREIADRLADEPPQAFFQLVRFERGLARIARPLHANGRYDGAGDIFHRPNSSGPVAAGLRPPQPNGRSRSGRRRRTLPGPDDPGPLDRETPVQTIVIANPKGGSGKTTLATNVAGWLAGKRQRVVLADADPQRSASQWLRRRPPLFPAISGQDGDTKKKDRKEFDPQW